MRDRLADRRIQLAACAMLALAGCRFHPSRPVPHAAEPLPECWAEYYAVPEQPIQPRPLGPGAVLERTSYTKHVLTFEPFVEEPHIQRPLIELYRFRDRSSGPRPGVVVSEFLSGRIPEWFVRVFLDEGWPVLVLTWPRNLLSRTNSLEDLEEIFRELIQNGRRAIDWFAAQEDVDGSRIACVGISFGALYNVLLAAVHRDEKGEPKLLYHVLAMAGEDLPEILLRSSERRVRRYREHLLDLHGWSEEELLERARAELISEPGRFTRYLDPDHLLMFLARFDTVVPYSSGLRLHRSLGAPDLYVVPTGHYTFALTHVPSHWLGRRLKEALSRAFEAAGSRSGKPPPEVQVGRAPRPKE